MKLIIAGGRDYLLTPDDYEWLDMTHHLHGITEVVSGACPSGGDAEGEAWAKDRSIPVKRFPAEWHIHGKYAGPKRNEQMAVYADAVVLFHGGRGTASMFNMASKHGIIIWDRRNCDAST